MKSISRTTRVFLFGFSMVTLLLVVAYKRLSVPPTVEAAPEVEVEELEIVEVKETVGDACDDLDFGCVTGCYDRRCVKQCLKPACLKCLTENYGPHLAPKRDDDVKTCTTMFGLSRDASFSKGAWQRVEHPDRFLIEKEERPQPIEFSSSNLDVVTYDLAPACEGTVARIGEVYVDLVDGRAIPFASRGFGTDLRWAKSNNYYLAYFPRSRLMLADQAGLTIFEKRIEGLVRAQISSDEKWVDYQTVDDTYRIDIATGKEDLAPKPIKIRGGAPIEPKCPPLEGISTFNESITVFPNDLSRVISLQPNTGNAEMIRYTLPEVRRQITPERVEIRTPSKSKSKYKPMSFERRDLSFLNPGNYHNHDWVSEPVWRDGEDRVYYLGSKLALTRLKFAGKKTTRKKLRPTGRFLRSSSDGKYLVYAEDVNEKTSFFWFEDFIGDGGSLPIGENMYIEDVDMTKPGVFFVLAKGRIYQISKGTGERLTIPVTEIGNLDKNPSDWREFDPLKTVEPPTESLDPSD